VRMAWFGLHVLAHECAFQSAFNSSSRVQSCFLVLVIRPIGRRIDIFHVQGGPCAAWNTCMCVSFSFNASSSSRLLKINSELDAGR